MLSRKNRLIKKEDFSSIYRGGKFFAHSNISAKIKKNGLDQTRLGISIGLKFSKKAVERNRIKRQIREAFQKRIGVIEKGWDVVFMAKKAEKNDLKNKSESVEKSLEILLLKAGLLKK
ncbi:MAG: ribonuclease protein component [Patescibacteria group bacterium]|nr:ribonuclease protein component [Patescibacteria group bacterium]